MFWFLPLLFGAGFIGGATAWVFDKYVIPYLTEDKLKDRAEKHTPMEVAPDTKKILSEIIGNKLKDKTKKIKNLNIGLEDLVKNTEKHSPPRALIDRIEEQLKNGSFTLLNIGSDENSEYLFAFEDSETERVFTGYQHNGKVLFSPERNKECIYTFEDSETKRVFVGTYYDGEVQSIEEIEYEEIESDLKRRLDREEIVIL